MESGQYFGEEQPHQQPDQQFRPPDVNFDYLLSMACWCRGASNSGYVNLVQDLMAQLKLLIGEEVEKAMIRVLHLYLPLLQKSALPPNSSSLPHQAESSESRSFKLLFKGDVPDTLYTMTKLEDQLTSLEVELLDESEKRVEDGLGSRVKIKIDVLDGDFDVEKKLDWTQEDYTQSIVKQRKKKGALLIGADKMALNKGIASVGHIRVTDNSKHTTSETFRLGATAEGLPSGMVVKAAITEAFRVKERRLKGSKHKEPSGEDDLYHLVHIGKNGPVHERARKAGICKVKHFLQCYDTNAQQLQQILGVPEAKWNEIVKNAKACKLPNVADESYRSNLDLTNYVQIEDQQQEHQRQGHERISLQHPSCSGNFDGGGHNPDAGSLLSNFNQMCSIPSSTIDATAAGQGSTLGQLGAFQPQDYEQLEASIQVPDLQQLKEWLGISPSREETNNVPEVTSKLLAACYVTKAANLFMVRIQQDSSAPKKKRKLK